MNENYFDFLAKQKEAKEKAQSDYNENYFDFLAKQKEAEEKAQSDYIDQLIEESCGFGEI